MSDREQQSEFDNKDTPATDAHGEQPQKVLPSMAKRLILYILSALCASNIVIAFVTETGFEVSITTIFASVFSALAAWGCLQRARGLPILPFLFSKYRPDMR